MGRVWMTRANRAVRRYPVVAVTVLVAVLGGAAALSGHTAWAAWGISIFALLIAVLQLRDMVRDLMHGRWGIDVLAIMAIIATVLVGEYWASLVIVLMLSGGEALEDYAAGRAKRELTSLLARAPQQAHRYEGSTEHVQDVPVGEVGIGDTLLVKPSEIVPVDGILLSEEATLDESSLTGESIPVERNTGEPLLSGSLNGERAFTMRVSARSADSQYQRIVALVAAASESRAPVVRLADRYAVPFTAVSLLIAGIAWLLSGDPLRFAEVLVVATPCPLLIAAPVAFMGGMSRAARGGVIVKNAGTLELLAGARTVAFDKTGTLTHGEPAVAAVQPTSAISTDELFSLVASAEQYSSHVLARSLVASAREAGVSLTSADDAREVATNGVTATIGGRRVVVGKISFVAEHAAGVVEAPLADGQLAVYVAVDGVFAGTVILSDRIRSNAVATLAGLAALGIHHRLMLTGDAAATAGHVASQLGIDDVRADLLPADKVLAIRGISVRPVIMVGDGVNDAPVLAAADVGIAMGAKGSTAASESADVVIMLDDLSRVTHAVGVARRTMHVAIQSIWLGIGMSVGLMLLGAFGFLPAIVGAALQEVVDLATILNALRALGAGRRPTSAVDAAARRAPSRFAAPNTSGAANR
ncbi:heavy metal translocating P-type ATPase [Parafrigoribacterium mesophilum]|uniref:heavy metal translocating P-type ATPase n=1 Tax=Parafrigoribacterium mesophilum TaxID=433646 RepID=UPI0031FDD16E